MLCDSLCIFLSNVGGAENSATAATTRGRFSDSRHYETKCLVSKEHIPMSMAELCYDKHHVWTVTVAVTLS